ncbi:MAG TPA: ABC transporter ATP-binding protein [Tepidisphaeraceae bacterium]|nr:ABC transporter ATP-binding protein [Tepidisphaeraceae bacterium]
MSQETDFPGKSSLFSRWRKYVSTTFRGVIRPAQQDLEDEFEPDYKPLDLKLVRRQLRWLAPYKKYYILGCSIGLVQVFFDMIGPKFMGHLIDFVVHAAKGTAATAPWFIYYPIHWFVHHPRSGQAGQIEHIAWVIGIWAVLIAASVFLQRLTILIMTWAGESVQFDVRRKLFSHLQTLSMSYYDKTRLGRIISRCTSDVGAMREVNVWGIWNIVANAMMVVIAAIFLLQTDWRIFVAICWLGPVIYLANVFYKMRAMVLQQIAREGYTRISTNLAENITGMRVVMAFNRQVPNLRAFNALQEKNTRNNVNVARINGVYQPLLQIITFMGRVIILAYGGYLVVSGTMSSGRPITVGSVVECYLYWDWFMNPIINFGSFYTANIMPGMVGVERILNLLDTKPDVVDQPEAKPLPQIVGHVKFENVTFGYKPERTVLHDVNFEAIPGSTTALVGATGSGKSSIISLIARFYQPQAGRVLVDGHDIRYVTGDSLHQQMGLVLQVNYLFTGSVLDNIRYAKPEATRAQIIEAAKALGTYDIISSLSNGFDTEVGERGGNMSLGQRQLICFTRAYLSDPRIFMLDEATSSVDTATELLVQRSLERLLRGRTTFIVAHRLSTIKRADQILVIDAGRIIERGNHRELLAHGGKYAQLYHEFVKQSE